MGIIAGQDLSVNEPHVLYCLGGRMGKIVCFEVGRSWAQSPAGSYQRIKKRILYKSKVYNSNISNRKLPTIYIRQSDIHTTRNRKQNRITGKTRQMKMS